MLECGPWHWHLGQGSTELLLHLTGSHLSIEYQPAGQTFVTKRIGSTTAAERDVGFRWQVELEEGMRRLIAWRQADQDAVWARRTHISGVGHAESHRTMCGITGIFNLNGEPVSPVILHRMTDAIAHRGPDSEGFYTDGCLGLGHRRLAIIDLSPAGHQPMITADGQYALTYNGEIYNFQELRLALEALGYQFRSHTIRKCCSTRYAAVGRRVR